MKQRIFWTIVMLMSFCSFSWADEELTLIAEIDWTEQTAYYDDVWPNSGIVSLKVDNGLVITSVKGEIYWDAQVPIIAHIPYVKKGGNYQMKFTLDAPTSGTIRLGLCSWDGSGATHDKIINVEAGEYEYTVDFEDYPIECTDAMISYQCGLIPGTHIIKKVQIWGPEDKREEYAVLSRDGKTLTFYNDEFKGSRDGVVCKINNATGLPGWYKDFSWGENNPNDKIETMVFDNSFSFSRPTTLDYWFRNQKSLTKIEGISNLNTSKVNNMNLLFSGCESLTTLDLSHFNTSQVTNMGAMFEECRSLTCVDLSKFATMNVNVMNAMFYNCKSLKTLDLTNFYTDNVENMSYMFCGCDKLESIYVGNNWSTAYVASDLGNYIFNGCALLKGENGTEYDGVHIDVAYAQVDGGSGAPGYLSSVSALYNLKVADREVSKTNCNDILGDGCFAYSPASKTLYVKDSYTSFARNDDIINSTVEGLTIVVTQDVVLEHREYGCPIRLLRSATIKGVGKLTLKANTNVGLHIFGGASATIDHMNMDVSGSWGISGPDVTQYKGENVTIISSNINISATEAALCDLPGGIVLQDCSFTFPEGAFIDLVADYGVKGPDGFLAKEVTIVADPGITTGVELQDQVQCSMFNVQCDGWYTIDGRKMSGKPTKKGIYIYNGKKVVN